MTHFGADCSHYQSTLNAAEAKAGGCEWLWIKSSEAASYSDPTYGRFSADCTRAGLPWGPYHFVREVATPAQQAAYWYSKAGGHGGALPMLDIETDPSTPGYVRALVAESDARFGLKVAIYTFDAFIDTHPFLSDYANEPGRTLVVARYSTNPPRHRHQAWQHTDKASFPGFGQPPDGDQTENLVYVLVGAVPPGPIPVPAPSPAAMENDMPTPVIKKMVLNPYKPTDGYLLDARGACHPIGEAPPLDTHGAYWSTGAVCDLVITDWAKGDGYLIDVLGGVHGIGAAPKLDTHGAYWPDGFVPPAP